MVSSRRNNTTESILLKCKFDERLGHENICSHINLALERAKAIASTTTK
ncbi:hypothetical protein HMPREF0653_01410 [Prevotella disiens JCM 6334 = ATCC 29426]|uniref:Uncharacterized protein n=1 Tax=Prevotella disiens JCM 6334 = ATCC 29426 TaxID=1235811 RepID=A0ABP2YAA5_9BACT|nr:hypothetical protein HMPREF0653_01410 [Prevotella disiens JCM 6334 = ATCC 29426]